MVLKSSYRGLPVTKVNVNVSNIEKGEKATCAWKSPSSLHAQKFLCCSDSRDGLQNVLASHLLLPSGHLLFQRYISCDISNLIALYELVGDLNSNEEEKDWCSLEGRRMEIKLGMDK